jgi:hypothetical protein
MDLFPLSFFLLGTVALQFVVVAVSAAVHSGSRNSRWLACQWASTIVLVVVVRLTLQGLPLVLAPGMVLAVAAAVAAGIAVRRQAWPARQGQSAAVATVQFGGIGAGMFGAVVSVYLLTASDQYVTQGSTCDAQGNCHVTLTGSPSPLVADPVSTLLLAALALAFFGLLAFSAVRGSGLGAPVWRVWL